ncbi:putative adhesin [Aeromonas veronii]
MQSRFYRHKNVVIATKGDGAKKAVIFAHGGFTPERGKFRKGSGTAVIPNFTRLHFNARHGSPSIGLKGGHMLQNGNSIDPLDVCLPGSKITNYSLTFNAKFEPFEPSSEYDVIKISPQGKAHMTDVFDALKIYGLMYEQIHSFACRIDKSTWAGTRSIGSPILHEK